MFPDHPGTFFTEIRTVEHGRNGPNPARKKCHVDVPGPPWTIPEKCETGKEAVLDLLGVSYPPKVAKMIVGSVDESSGDCP